MKQKLIYILGAGRSGTTILDIVLGNCSGSISLGEINRFFKRNGIAPKREINSKEYVFWDKIKGTFDMHLEGDYSSFKKAFDKNEYHTHFLKLLLFGSDKFYQNILIKQYESIAEHTKDKKVLIESSKYPARALNVSSALKGKMEVGYVYLKKDPVKVVSSFGKKGLEQPAKPFLASNLYYFTINVFCYLTVWKLRKRGHNVVVLKYEDLIEEPSRVLDRIESKLGIEVEAVKDKINDNETLDTGYLFDGNRIRLKDYVVLQRDLKKANKKGFPHYFTRGFNYLVYR